MSTREPNTCKTEREEKKKKDCKEILKMYLFFSPQHIVFESSGHFTMLQTQCFIFIANYW